jgi:hypothetical protein
VIYDAVTALFAQEDVPSKLPVNPPVELTEPVTINPLPETSRLPVITADPEKGNPDPPVPPFNAKEAVNAYDELIMLLDPKGPNTEDPVT